MQSAATAVWQGGLQEGGGKLTSASSVLAGAPYSYQTRFDGEPGTNPEELIAAAHAGCFAMALAMILGQQDLVPDRIEAEAKVTLSESGGGFAVTRSHLIVAATVPGATPEAFEAAAEAAKTNCPISKLLDTEIVMDARLDA